MHLTRKSARLPEPNSSDALQPWCRRCGGLRRRGDPAKPGHGTTFERRQRNEAQEPRPSQPEPILSVDVSAECTDGCAGQRPWRRAQASQAQETMNLILKN